MSRLKSGNSGSVVRVKGLPCGHAEKLRAQRRWAPAQTRGSAKECFGGTRVLTWLPLVEPPGIRSLEVDNEVEGRGQSGGFNDSPFHQLTGIRVVQVGPEHSVVEMNVAGKHLDADGCVHGGLCAALVASAVKCALIGHLGQSGRCLSLTEMKLNYLAPVLRGRLVAEGRVLRCGSSLALGIAEVRDGEGNPVALGTATFMLGNEGTHRVASC